MRNDLIKISFGIIVGIFISLMFKGCGNNDIDIYKSKQNVKTTHHSDTVLVHHTDTVYQEGPTKYVYLTEPTIELEEYFVHEYDKEDLKAKITTYNNGLQDLEYSVTCPVITNTDTITITNTDTVTITNDNYIEKNKVNLFVGTELGYTPSVGITGAGFNATLQLKNKYQVYYEYGVSFNKELMPDQHRVGIKIPITFGGRK